MKNEERIIADIHKVMHIYNLHRMPTYKEIRDSGIVGLSALIDRNGGIKFWKNKLNLLSKEEIKDICKSEEIESKILFVKKELGLSRMPTLNETCDFFGDSSLAGKISKTKGFDGWANYLGLKIKDSDSKTGHMGEGLAEEMLSEKGYCIEKMSLLHPFDFLVNDSLKIDIKIANKRTRAYNDNVYTFRTSKEFGSCDLYLLLCKDGDNIVHTYIIPSFKARVTTLEVCPNSLNSKYEKYKERWDIFEQYITFYNELKI